MMKLTKKSKAEAYNNHIGSGTIIYKSAQDELTYIDFYTSRKDGKLYSSVSGKLIEKVPIVQDLDIRENVK